MIGFGRAACPCQLIIHDISKSHLTLHIMLLALVFVYYFSQRSVAAPIADVRLVEDISPSCDKLGDCRTLLSIISSCIATIVACVWTAVHPDIPPYGEDPWWQRFRRMLFTISGIIAPEVYILIATMQYLSAREIARMDVFKEHGWTTTHGFFVLMGGFALCNPSEHSTKQLHAKEVINLINKNEIEFPYVSEEEIQDRSKANWLSKTAAVVQTCWFALQVLARFIERLPITELEIFTAGFTVMAIAMYALWFKKPFCIDVPIVLHEQPKAITVTSDTLSSIAIAADAPNLNRIVEEADWPTNTNEVELGLLDSHSRSTDVQSNPGPRTSDVRNAFYRGLQYAVWAVTSIILAPIALIFGQAGHQQWWHFPGVSNEPKDSFKTIIALVSYASTLVTPILFGLIHCTAWSLEFPTVVEQYLWRVLSLVITCSPIPEAPLIAIGVTSSNSSSLPQIVKHALKSIFTSIVAILYVVSRLTLLVIAFTTLRKLPPGVYEAISWVELIPHF
ncbi:uncharacterized protein LAESUDRAFT_705002 [Laetiporus sulphureus 93-53]|uniref:Uncharacterized protein n=1 Tax=Laetiporus sulphureus 93-53 TaxID=1314785 RepID=A0A165CP81_9APHY|nr:uncharacterized protein LAESUDRAFT_705002 [Laetiporus sulphureus 93-53]KZT03166.1 hypothetical protein LAESUDRAFT_705002 [Laetiporus sulphureus 93-53]